MTEYNPMAVKGHNSAADKEPEDKASVFKSIDALYEEATHWADGTDVENIQQHDAVTLIRETLHDLGKKADELRKDEKEPLDVKIAAIQTEYNPYIQKDRGKVDRAKKCLDAVLSRWRIRIQREKDEAARIAREKAAAEKRAADEAIRESRGNLLAREEAEQKLEDAKRMEAQARRSTKAATTRTGLRTVKTIKLPEEGREAALDWAFEHDAESFYRHAIEMASSYYRSTTRVAPGFELVEEKVAR